MSPLSGWWDEEKVIFDYLKNEVGLKSRNEMINYIASHQQELQKKFPDFISLAVGHYTNIVEDVYKRQIPVYSQFQGEEAILWGLTAKITAATVTTLVENLT